MTLTDSATTSTPSVGKPSKDSRVPAKPHVHVLLDRCAGCQECIIRCPAGALHLDPVTWTAFADDDACVGCRQCVRTCPFSAILVEGPMLVAPRSTLGTEHPAALLHNSTETRHGITSWSEALAEASRCLDCPDPTCVRGCPAHNDIPGFIRALQAGDLDESHRVLRRTSFLPDVCSRVCDQALQCEGACTWSLAGGSAVAIGALERFITDNAPVPPLGGSAPVPPLGGSAPVPPLGGSAPVGQDGGSAPSGAAGDVALDVAVVGSGPAGIAAASELRQAGANVTVYERDSEPGGLLRWGIPDFTLPDAVARRPWETLLESGVRLELGSEVNPKDLDGILERYDAVVLAAGAGTPLRLPVPGGDLDRVWDATRFLTRAHAALQAGSGLEELQPFSGEGQDGSAKGSADASAEGDPATVLVLGAGNTAMDVARSARRLGARAVCVDWMDRRFAPVRPDELDEAAAEGVEVRFCTTLERLEGVGGRVRFAHLARTRQESSSKLPEVLHDSTTVERIDLVVMAMGYRIAPEVAEAAPGVPVRKVVDPIPDRRWQASGLLANPAPPFARSKPVGALALGREHAWLMSGLARRERVWVAGDALTGPSTVVEAMAQGKRAAQAIIQHAPRRPGREGAPGGRVLVAVESRSGTTAARAGELAAILHDRGAQVRVVPMRKVGTADIAWADSLVVASWVEGFVVAKVGPARPARAWLAGLPPLAGMPTSLLCTYAVSPGTTLAQMRRAIESHGGKVIAEAAISRRAPGGGAGGAGSELARVAEAMLPSSSPGVPARIAASR